MKLTVYKASAGSGKTYTLTREYLKQALRYAGNPYLFRSILAVTFTNKATEEMKKRIITTLNDLVQGNDDNLSKELQGELKIDHVELQDRAQKVRSAILHDYTHFSVSTIDTFFQKILHAFVREARLRPGFNLELDTNRLLEEAVDKLIQESSADETLRKWLFTLIENRIEDRSSWDMRPLLLALGSEVFSEHYRRFGSEFHAKTSNKALMEQYAQSLNEIISDFDKKLRGLGKLAIKTIKSAGLEITDFKYGKAGFANFFYKIAKGVYEEPAKRVFDALECFDGWVSKNAKRFAEIEGIYTTLLPLLIEAVEYWQENIKQYNTACEIARKFRELGVLADIDKNIKEIAGEENLMPISDSVHLLSTLINDSDTPFVYERTGNRYKTFLIDEFQDTSVTQWKNFRPLLHNSLSENQFNMVVGDVKQSIYRWRNGDWRILAYQLAQDFDVFGLDEKNLNTNWRSKTIVIEFNNALFSRLAAHLQLIFNNTLNENTTGVPLEYKELLETIIPTAYTDTEQNASSKTAIDDGYVSIDIIPCEEEETSNEIVLERLPLLIASLQDRGYNANDIAILVRRRGEGQQIANTLLSHKKASGDTVHCFDVISQDSLFIGNSSIVQIIIAAMRMAINPNDPITTAFLQHELLLRKNKESSAHIAFSKKLSDDEFEFIYSLSNQSLSQAFELIVRHYSLNENIEELPFLQEIHDIITTFSNRKLSDISSFIDWWDDKGHTTTLSPGENQKAINIMTVHKSKGLQFPVVIVPFANWSLEPKIGSTIWVSPQEEPFNKLPYVPVMYSKALQNTDFNTEYLTEKVQSYVDNINLMYVAFTRAESELYISIPKAKRENRSSISVILPEFFKQYAGVNNTFDFGKIQGAVENEGLHIEFGTKRNYQSKKIETTGLLLDNYPSTVFQRKLRLHYDSEDFFNLDPKSPFQRRNYGILMHRVFEEIATVEESGTAINRLFDEGLIDDEGKQTLTLKLKQALQHPIACQWFDGSWEIKAETGVLLPHNDNAPLTRRPDRVMIRSNETLVIDYKFGLIEEKKYSRQLSSYVTLLKQMGYPNVKAYIWYVDLEKVVEVV